ncbi:hypothetical protein DICPUDRAFT_39877, partial [Dictyostelium purpureum]
TVYSNYNKNLKQFEFEFNIPMNIKTGNVSYFITLDSRDNVNYFSFSLPIEYQLRIKESKNIDLFGPVVTNVKTIPSIAGKDKLKTGYTLEIKDNSNGFKYGYIIVKGSNDMTERNITIDSSNLFIGTVYRGVYSVYFEYDIPCITQTFSIVYAYFEDTQGYFTEFN